MNEMFCKSLSTRVVRVDGEYKDDGYVAENENRDRTKKPSLFDTARTSQLALFNPDGLSVVLRRTRAQDKGRK